MANLGVFHHPICLSSPYRTTTISHHHHHHRYTPLRQTKLTFKFSANSQLKENNNTNNNARESQPPTLPTVSEKKSFAVATGELFIGIASRFIKSRNPNINAYGGNDTNTLLPAESEILRDPTEYVSGRLKSGVGRMAEEAEFVKYPVLLEEKPLKDFNEEKDMKKKLSSPGFSFSAAGLLFPYHLGVAKFLIENGYIKETTPLAGSSAGAIVCAVIASGSSMQEALDATKILAADCRLKGTAFRLGAVLRDVLEKFLPDDVHIRSNGRVRVAVTQILWRPRSLLIDQFDSKEDLINAVFTSSFIPGYLAPRPATLFRNRLCVDGGLTLFMPPTSAAKTVRVCAFPTVRLGLQGIGISPDCNPENRATPRELFKWALEPADDDVLDRLFELGYLDAAVWAEQNQVTEAVEDISTTADLLN